MEKDKKEAEESEKSIECEKVKDKEKIFINKDDGNKNNECYVFPLKALPIEIIERIMQQMSNKELQTLRWDSELDEIEMNMMKHKNIKSIYIESTGKPFLNISTSEGLRYSTYMYDENIARFTLEWFVEKAKRILKSWKIDTVKFKFYGPSHSYQPDLIKICTSSTVKNLVIDQVIGNIGNGYFSSRARNAHSALQNLVTDKFLHELMRTKESVEINFVCVKVTPQGILDLFQALLRGEQNFRRLGFTGNTNRTVYAELDKLMRNSELKTEEHSHPYRGRTAHMNFKSNGREMKRKCLLQFVDVRAIPPWFGIEMLHVGDFPIDNSAE